MKTKEPRFESVYQEGRSGFDAGSRRILVDKETGVHYLAWGNANGAGITPLLDSEGKPIVKKYD